MGIFSLVYRAGLICHRSFNLYIRKPDELPFPVISVGNVTVGGTGKTPAVMAIAREAKRHGFMPCVLTRGYRGRRKDTCFVSKGGSLLLNAEEAGDEGFLIASGLEGIPVVKGSNRHEAGMLAISEISPAQGSPESRLLFILDDGFQHWRLKRDIDIVLIDATDPFGNGRLIPEGILREPLDALRRADIIALTKSDLVEEDFLSDTRRKILGYNPFAPLFFASHRPVDIVNISGKSKGIGHLNGRDVYVFAGIANTGQFETLVSSCGARIRKSRVFRDHHMYSPKDIDVIKKDADGLDIITTEKDIVKLKDLKLPDNLYALRIEFSISTEFYETIFRRLK